MSIASVTVAHVAFSDPKIAYLAQLAGYADVDHAIGKLAKLWGRCTFLGTDCPGVTEIRACMGARGEEHLLEAGLAERLPNGELRVKGRVSNESGVDRFAWFRESSQQSSAGQRRASTAQRDARGRMLPNTSAGRALVKPLGAGPASGSGSPEEDLSPAREGDLPLPELVAAPEVTRSPDASLEAELEASERSLRERQALRKQSWDKLNAVRRDVAKELRVEARPLHPQDPGERALGLRIREAESVEVAATDIEHVIAIATAEARAQGSVQWLTGALFEERSWRRALGMTAADAARDNTRKAPASRGTNNNAEAPIVRGRFKDL